MKTNTSPGCLCRPQRAIDTPHAFRGNSNPFMHPGIEQGADDLKGLKDKVESGASPWAGAFADLSASVNQEFRPEPVAHAAYGGHRKDECARSQINDSAKTAYDCALLWAIGGDPLHARKAIEILNAWAATLWDFDENNAKLMAANCGSTFCKAAEILRHTAASGWAEPDRAAFDEWLMTVFLPLLRNFFPEANGNWNAFIIRAMMLMGIVTDRRDLFENAIDHLLYAPGNGSLLRYIHPNGQCQECVRDHGHVQMGLGAYVNIAQIAWTQGVDLFSIADNRLAAGIEYECRILLEHPVFCYGEISERKRAAHPTHVNYLHALQHYEGQGIELPALRELVARVWTPDPRHILTAYRHDNEVRNREPAPRSPRKSGPVQAGARSADPGVRGSWKVCPGQSLQNALDRAADSGGGVVLAQAGMHRFPESLRLPTGVTLCGEGRTTVLQLDSASRMRDAILAAGPELHNVCVRDLVVEGAAQPYDHETQSHRSCRSRARRGGIVLHAEGEAGIRNVRFENLTVRNCTNNGIWITGGCNLVFESCDLDENGSDVVPGPRIQHNLALARCRQVRVRNCRLDGSPCGCGASLIRCEDVRLDACEIARNGHHGLLVSECAGISLSGSLVEANGDSGFMIEFLWRGSREILLRNNCFQYNNGAGVESHGAVRMRMEHNLSVGNARSDTHLGSDSQPTARLHEVRRNA